MLTARQPHARTGKPETPVELRFVDMLLIIIATLMFVAVLLTIASAFAQGGRSDMALRIVTRSAPAALTGQPYQLRLAAEGGDGSYAWQITAGRLPQGLFLLSDGTVAGEPAKVGSAIVTIEVVDGQQRSARQSLAFEVRSSGAPTAQILSPPHVISRPVLLPAAVSGQPYQFALTAQGGLAPYHWLLANSKLPRGLFLTDQGNLTGRPEAAGTAAFTVRIVDSAGSSATQAMTLTIRDAAPAVWQVVFHWVWLIASITGILIIVLIIIESYSKLILSARSGNITIP